MSNDCKIWAKHLQQQSEEIKQKWTGAENNCDYVCVLNFRPLLQKFYFWKED